MPFSTSIKYLPNCFREYGVMNLHQTHKVHSYLAVFQNALYSLPVRRETGEHLTHEEVVNQLDRDTVSYDTSLGFGSSFTEVARISIKVETANYQTAVSWIWDLLHGSVFDVERY